MNSGISLIDTLVALTLLGSLALVSAPTLSDLQRSRTLRSETEELRLFLEQLALNALQREERYSLDFTSTSIAVNIASGPHAGTVPSKRPLKSPITVVSPLGLNQLAFHSSGAASPATISLTDGKQYCSLYVSLRGRVRSQC